jgi:hypothetical protein
VDLKDGSLDSVVVAPVGSDFYQVITPPGMRNIFHAKSLHRVTWNFSVDNDIVFQNEVYDMYLC